MEKRPAAWLWVAALVPTLILAVVRWSAGPGIGAEDYAQYQLHARALVEGRPYRDTGYLFSRLNAGHSPAVLPPGVPIALAVAFEVVGERPASVKSAMLLLSFAFFALAGLYFAVAANEPWFGVGVILFIGLSPGVVRYAGLAQSDLPLCFGVWLLFLLADRPGVWSWRRVAAIAVAGLVAMSFRLLGVVLIPVMLVVAALRWSELRWKGLVPPLVWLAFGLGGIAVLGTSMVDRFPTLARALITNPGNHWTFYRIASGEALLVPFHSDMANHYYQIVALALSAVGLLVWIRGAWRQTTAVFSALYLGLLLVSPFYAARYLWPLFPLLIYGFLKGVALLVSRVRPGLPAVPVALAAATCIAVASTVEIATNPPPGWFATRPETIALLDELRRLNVGNPIRVSFSRPRILALEAGIPSMALVNRSPDVIEGELNAKCITHIVIGSLGLRKDHDAAYRRMVTARPNDFEPVWSNDEFQVFRYLALRPDNCPTTIRGGFTAR